MIASEVCTSVACFSMASNPSTTHMILFIFLIFPSPLHHPYFSPKENNECKIIMHRYNHVTTTVGMDTCFDLYQVKTIYE